MQVDATLRAGFSCAQLVESMDTRDRAYDARVPFALEGALRQG